MTRKQGFTLIETLVYIVVLVIILVVVISFLSWSIRINVKAKIAVETLNSAKRIMEIIDYEIRSSKSIYNPTSIFKSRPIITRNRQSSAGRGENYVCRFLFMRRSTLLENGIARPSSIKCPEY